MKYLTLSIPGSGGKPIKLEPSSGVPSGGLDMGSNILGVLINLIIIIAILFSIFLMIRGGMNMMTSGGDKEKFQRGRERIRYAIIGLIIIFLSFGLVNLIGTFFGVNLLSFYK